MEPIQIIIAGICTIAIFSFLFGENPVYRFFEHFYIGIATAITIFITLKNYFWTQVLRPLLGLDIAQYPLESLEPQYDKLKLLMIGPMLFGLLYYCILSKRLNWLARLPIGFALGVSGGMAFEATFNELMPQIIDSFRPLYIPGNIEGTIANLVFAFTLFTSMSYFFFTFKSTNHKLISTSAGCGRWMMMACFGAFFGSTIMARMSLLVERINFLVNPWFDQVWSIVGGYF